MKILCKLFGHNFDSIEVALLKLTSVAENKRNLSHTLTCKRCKEKFVWMGREEK